MEHHRFVHHSDRYSCHRRGSGLRHRSRHHPSDLSYDAYRHACPGISRSNEQGRRGRRSHHQGRVPHSLPGSITKEQWQHYCNDLITAESRANVTGCEAPKDDYMGHKDEIRRIENIVIDGDKATATVDYHTVLYGGGDATIQETLYWEDGRWKLDSRMRNDR